MVNHHFLETLDANNGKFSIYLPSKPKAQQFVDQLIHFLFPITAGVSLSIQQLELRLMHLRLEFEELLEPLACYFKHPLTELTDSYFNNLPVAYELLLKDAKAIEEFDPAAYSIEEIIISYPGFYAIAVHRLAHHMYTLEIPILPRVISEYAHSLTGIDIHPGARIGESFFIDHGTGIVIGETTDIGVNVKMYQGVTLGALSVKKLLANKKRHPTIEDNVIIYSGSTILGGDTVIGHDSIIGGNVWLTESVEPYTVVYNKHEVSVRNTKG
ncbi:MAG: serine O-acetyltransferase EpsC [Bacteroidota bacterium]